MKLWLISQEVNNDYDTFDSAVVAAETDKEAQKIEVGSVRPNGYGGSWVASDHVKARYIGEAAEGTEAGVILASFNAG